MSTTKAKTGRPPVKPPPSSATPRPASRSIEEEETEQQSVPAGKLSRWRLKAGVAVLLGVGWLVLYLLTVSPTVNFIDSGELITALHEPGVAHPPGYPLYTLLGYVVSNLLPGEVAWRVNVISAVAAASAVALLFLLVCEVQEYTQWLALRPASNRVAPRSGSRGRQKPQAASSPAPTSPHFKVSDLVGAAAAACLLGASATFWSRAVQAKMYALHYLFVAAIFLFAVRARRAYDLGNRTAARRWLVAALAALGLSLTNHLITTLLIPGVALLIIWGRDWLERVRWALGQWKVTVPAFVLPLLLYLYLPIRSAENPVMNWGTPSNLGDFVRHVTGWQYSVYLGEDLGKTAARFWDFLASQWGNLGWIVVPIALLALVLLARANLALFISTAVTAAATAVFSLKYGSSEMAPYIVPLYMMFALWAGVATAAIASVFSPRDVAPTSRDMSLIRNGSAGVAGLLVLLALVTAFIQFPAQDHSRDHLAEQFALNTYKGLEPNSIVLTDLWDLASPSYYMQLLKGVRPDIVVIDKLLLKYPWYVGQLEKRYPWLIANSRDIAEPYRAEQLNWVNGQPYDAQKIGQLYIDLMTSFVERNIDKHPAYAFFTQGCDPSVPPQYCENNRIAPTYTRFPAGLAFRLLPQAPSAGQLPPVPDFDLRGFTYDKTPLDDFARYDGELYVGAYRNAAQFYTQAGKNDVAADLLNKASQLDAEIKGR